jgi:ubiquinone/menaquinone biosynthesis C-methylase UbiE
MPIARILEPEVMDAPQDAEDYDRMDHSAVNRVFVDDLLAAIQESGVGSQESDAGGQRLEVRGEEGQSLLTSDLCSLTSPPLDILDLGTGTALIPIELCRRLADCRVMAVDAATSMLDLARYNLESASLTQRIQLAHIDAKKLPYKDGLFDVVMSNSIVHHIPEPLPVLREAVRVTKSGGLLFIRDLLRPDSAEQLNHQVATYAADCNAHQRQLFADSLHAALSLDEIRELVGSLGFAPETVQQTSDRHWTWRAVNPTSL